MKPSVKKLPQLNYSSFAVQTVCTPYFKTGLQQHIEYELILFIEGTGLVWIGDFEGKYETGDIFILGSNLAHAFQSTTNKPVTALGIQFRNNCWGNYFINLPECHEIKQLLEISSYGLQVTGNSQRSLQLLIKDIEKATGIYRTILLLQCLQEIGTANDYIVLSQKKAQELIKKNQEVIDAVVEFTMVNFHETIALSKAAAMAYMSVPSFCHYFKQYTHKTYNDFLNEVRINYACQQLIETNKPVADICYESGYNTVAHFHRQFLRSKKITPLQYRKRVFMREKQLNELPAVA
jgi:AraC-like DNA-binding protein